MGSERTDRVGTRRRAWPVSPRISTPGLAIGVTALVIVLGGWAYAAIPTTGGTIRACVANTNDFHSTIRHAKGSVRFVVRCRPDESAVLFNQRGPTGATGAAGAIGAPGAPGAKGDTGAPGAKGLTGADGESGERGPRGLTGDAGLKGDKGDTGATGLKGDKGDTGATGLKGDKGDTGATGLKGDKGDAGTAGLKGDKGDAGTAGLKGDKGDAGATGLKGDTGLTGPRGPGLPSYAAYLTPFDSSLVPVWQSGIAPIKLDRNGDGAYSIQFSDANGCVVPTLSLVNAIATTVQIFAPTCTSFSVFLRSLPNLTLTDSAFMLHVDFTGGT